MQQKDLAILLDISPAMVSRLAKRGMPTDTLERAQRWRKRHLEPARVKGSRFDENRKAKPTAPAPSTPNPSAAALFPNVSLAEVEFAGEQLDKALTDGCREQTQMMIRVIRVLLQALPAGAWPTLTLQVWQELTADVRALFPPPENNPLCDDGSPVYVASMTDDEEEAAEIGRFWFEVAAGLWTVKNDNQPTAP